MSACSDHEKSGRYRHTKACQTSRANYLELENQLLRKKAAFGPDAIQSVINLESQLATAKAELTLWKEASAILFGPNAIPEGLRLESENKRLREALEGLVNQLMKVHNDPRYMSVWTLSQVHQGPYDGPTYGTELMAAKAALDGGKIKASELYPCIRCGANRTKDEGGTVFTTCDECWDKDAGKAGTD